MTLRVPGINSRTRFAVPCPQNARASHFPHGTATQSNAFGSGRAGLGESLLRARAPVLQMPTSGDLGLLSQGFPGLETEQRVEIFFNGDLWPSAS